MVFVMVSHIERHEIQLAVVAKGFLLSTTHQIMPLDPPRTQRVQADGEEEGQCQIGE